MLFQDIIKILGSRELMGYMLEGFRNTLLLTLAAAAIGLVLGFTVAIVKISAPYPVLISLRHSMKKIKHRIFFSRNFSIRWRKIHRACSFCI